MNIGQKAWSAACALQHRNAVKHQIGGSILPYTSIVQRPLGIQMTSLRRFLTLSQP